MIHIKKLLRESEPEAYSFLQKSGLLDKMYSDLSLEPRKISKPFGYWTLEICKKSVSNYPNKREWRKHEDRAYNTAKAKGWLDECLKIIDRNSFLFCKKDALKYKTRTEWQKKSGTIYHTALRSGWFERCCKHMEFMKRPKGHWTFERCKKDALKYKTRTGWQKKNQSAYSTALQNGWLEECSRHMKFMKRPKGYWTLAACKKDALKYKTKAEWDKNSSGCTIARHKGWLDKCSRHMVSGCVGRKKSF